MQDAVATSESNAGLDVLFMLFGAALVFFMQVGFALLEVGSVSIRNTKNTLFKNLLDVCCGAVSFYLFGYGFLHGDGDGFVGSSDFALSGGGFLVGQNATVAETASSATLHARFFFAFSFAATSATIVSGAVAERFLFKAYALYTAVITGFLYPIVAHWVWSNDGWASPCLLQGNRLFDSGAVDYAGALVVHVTGGLAALIACVVVGPRVGRFNAGIPMLLPMQSPVFQTAGTMFLWFGWYGFNCVAVGTLDGHGPLLAAKAAVSTTLAAAAGGGAVMVTDTYLLRIKAEPRRMNNGILCGLVAVSGCAGLIHPHNALVIGAVAGFIYVKTSGALLVWGIDDVVDAVPVHFFGGVWGILASALFVNENDYVLRYGYPVLGDSTHGSCGVFMGCSSWGAILGANVMLLLSTVGWIGVTCYVSLHLIKKILGGSLRVPVNHELKGMDASAHGGRSYTEFQTTVFTFKTPGGGEHSMEMRVRAGDAAKFAMALSEVMENPSSGSLNSTPGNSGHGSRRNSQRMPGKSSATQSDSRMVFQAEDLDSIPAALAARAGGVGNGSVSHVSGGGSHGDGGNVAYKAHSRGVTPPMPGSGGSIPGSPVHGSRHHALASADPGLNPNPNAPASFSLTVVDEASGSLGPSGRNSPAISITKDGEPFDPFDDAARR